ncbi:hypothetical protein ACFQT0_07710 [Hymenobacter humi]|uniref:Translocation/assembly module TamB n=1 Tax=Hymenobacter humi TaxID=1411620 RepID=A0ABW2U4P5_9BACT
MAATVDLDRNRYVINANSKNDPNLDLDLRAVVNLRDANNPTYEVTSLNLRGANLTALGFYTGGDLRVQGNLNANISGSSLNTLNGTIRGTNVVLVRDNQPFAFDTLSAKITQTATRAALDFNSNIVAAKLDGNVHLGDLAPELQQHLDRYFDLPGVRYAAGSADRRFTYSLQLKDGKLATKLVPGLKEISPFTLAGDYSRRDARLTANTSIPVIRYENYRVDSLRLNVGSDASKLDYGLRMAQAAQDTTLKLRRPSIIGNVADNKVFTRVAILGDSANREQPGAGRHAAGPDGARPHRRGGVSICRCPRASHQLREVERWPQQLRALLPHRCRGGRRPAPDQRPQHAGPAKPESRGGYFAAGRHVQQF